MVVFKFNYVLFSCKSFRMNVILIGEVDKLTFEVVVAAAFKTS